MVFQNKQVTSSAFQDRVYKTINDYFKVNHLSKYANRQMYIKLGIAFAWWMVSFVLLFTLPVSAVGFFGLYAFHIFSQLYMQLNISHDANHQSIVKNKVVANALRYTFDICGVNSYMWRELHHSQHHYVMNIDGEDENLVARGLFRFTERARFRFFHKFQHFYFPVLYGFFSSDYILTKDFECFFLPYTKYLKEKKHPPAEYVKLFLFKFWYVGYMIILPIVYLNYSVGFIIGSFFLCHFMIGLIGGFVIQLTHPLSSAEFPASKNEYDNFAHHVFATTADYSVKSKIADWCFGGLHLHVVHHLTPHICHTHYAALTERVKTVAKEFNVPYRVNETMWDAVREHYTHLKNLSTTEVNYGRQ